MAFVEDLSVFFDTGVFADAATLAGIDVVGIYDGPYNEAIVGLAEGFAPTFTLPTADAANAIHGSTLVIATGHGAGTYKVREIKPDGTGVTVLTIEAQ